MGKWGKRMRGAVAATAALLVVLPSTGSARAGLPIAGVCHLTVSTGIQSTTPPASLSTVNVGGSGPCWVAGDYGSPFTGTLAGSLTGVFGCYTGAAVGTGTFVLVRPGFPGDLALTVAATAAGVLTVAGAEARFTGAGVFVPDTGAATACTSGPTEMTWTGKLVFEQATVAGEP